MANLTRKQRRELEQVLYHMNRALVFISNESVAVACRDNMATTTLHYTRPDGACLYEIAKDIGSDLTGLPDAVRHLSRFLAPKPAAE